MFLLIIVGMCRLFGFHSSLLSGAHRSLVAADNALARQSGEHPDGWGVAHYEGGYPHLIRGDKQALEDGLFKEVSGVVTTRTLLAHVRRATVGEISVLNCHPFQHGPWTFAHNGELPKFKCGTAFYDAVYQNVDLHFRRHIFGTTDSEIIFFIFLSQLARRAGDIYSPGIPSGLVIDSLRETVTTLRALTAEYVGDDSGCILTILLTNGSFIMGARGGKELFYSTHKRRCPERDSCHAFDPNICEQEVKSGRIKHLVMTSEKISEEPNIWSELKDGEYVFCDHGMNFGRNWLCPQ